MLHKMIIGRVETQNNVEHTVVTIEGNMTIERTSLCVCGGSRDSSVGGGDS